MIEEGGVAVSLYKVEVRRIIKIIRKDKSLPEQNSISGSENIARKGTPQCLRLSAVFTLEAAVVMPVLACFFVSVLFFFRIMQIQLEVQKALDNLSIGRTVLVVAHRLSTIKGADRIAVIDNGIVAECGSHDELLKKDGLYAKLQNVHSQQGGEAL